MNNKDTLSDFLKFVGALTLGVGLPVLAIVGISKLAESVNRFSTRLTPYEPLVRNTAVRIARESPGPYNIGQAFAIFDWVKRNIRYVSDPADSEYIAFPRETIQNLAGDCDDMAVLTASMIKAIGGLSRVVAVYNPAEAHAFAELYIGSTDSADAIFNAIQERYICARQRPIHWENDNFGGKWLIFDTLLDYPGALPLISEERQNAWSWREGSRVEYHY